MAHKTLVGGTAYEITGGKTLISGTSYSIKNGKVLIGGTAYDISFLLPPNVLNMWAGNSYNYGGITCIAYANGYWVVGGYAGASDGSTHYARIAYATQLNGAWTKKDLWNGISDTHVRINCIAYANGYWVVGGGGWTSYPCARIAYATAPGATWTTKDLWGGAKYQNGVISALAYGNGMWAAVGFMSTGSGTGWSRISYATTPSGTWTTKDLWTSSDNRINCIAYANGYWVVGGAKSRYVASIAYATTPSGAWTTKDLWTRADEAAGGDVVNCIAYANGYWVVGGKYTVTYSARIAYATAPGATWTTKDLWKTNALYPKDAIIGIASGNGYWVVGGFYQNKARIAYVTSPSGTWTTKDLTSNFSNIYAVNCVNGYWLLGGNYNDAYARLAYAGTPAELGESN